MAEPNSPYDDDADERRAPNPNLDKLQDAEANGDDPYSATNTAGGGNQGGSSSTTGSRGPGQRFDDDDDSEPDTNFKFNPKDKSDRGNIRLVLRAANKHRKVMLIGTGLAGGVVGTVVVVFFMLIPLKIEHIISNLQDRFFATSENAVDKETSNMLSDYIKKSVLPALTSCKGTSIDKSCNPAFGPSSNPVDALYNGWTQARLENKLASNYGIEFRYNKVNHKYYMKVPGVTSSTGDDITAFKDDGKNLFQEVSRGQVRTAVSDAMQNETKWKQVMYRYKVGRLLEEKYGITRCLIFCGTRDALADKIADQKVAAKLYLVQNILTPRTQVLGIVMECLLDTSCDPEHTQPTVAQDTTNTAGSSTGSSTTTADGTVTITTGTEEAGAPKDTTFDAKVLKQFAASRGVNASEDQLAKAWQKYHDDGFSKIIAQEVFGKIGLGDLAGQAVDNASIIGWVNKASTLTVDAENAGPKLTKLSYITNSSADVQMFSMYRTYADEIHTGHVTATEVGSMVDSLGPVASSTGTKDLVGGTASAEQTPLYSNLINKTSTATGSHDYTCAPVGGKPAQSPGNDLICPEEKLGGKNAASGISAALSQPPLSYIASIANAWNGVVGGISNFIGNIFGSIITNIPGVGSIIKDAASFVSQAAKPFLDFLTNKLVSNPFSTNMSGGRTFDLVAEGADVAGNDFAHTGLGGKAVSAVTAGQIANAEANQAQQDFSHQSFFARMFSTDSQYSLVSRIAMDIPLNLQASAESGFATLLDNPFGTLAHSFASILSGKASASTAFVSGVVDGKDVAGVTQYVPDTPDHPGDYWAANCSDNASQAYQKDNSWNQQAADPKNVDPDTGQPENTTANPCLAIKTTVCSAGATSDSSLCTPDDTADLNSGSTSSSTPAPTAPASPAIACSVDDSAAPDLAAVAATIKSTCEQNFPKIEALLSPSPFPPPHKIVFTNGNGTGPGIPANTMRDTVYLNIAYFRRNPTDIGVIVHEDTHVVQGYGSKVGTSQAPHWLVEGMADWVRYHLGYTQSSNYHCTGSTTYLSGYNCGAVFLDYLSNYDSNIVQDAHNAIRQGTYDDTSFIKQKTGSDLTTLYNQCLASNCTGGKGL